MNSSAFRYLYPILFIGISILSFSCASKKDYVYFQKAETDSGFVSSMTPAVTLLAPGDIVSIGVSAADPDVVKPFNVNSQAVSEGAKVSNTTLPSYLIDEQGNIDFPVIGLFKIAGLSSADATRKLKDKIKAYVNNPLITLKIQTHKVSVLGEVKTPGVYPISNERLTLPEALAMAGDLQISGVRKNVLVVREANGLQTETRVDMTSRKLFMSPVYYLQHNDIVYVEPNKSKIQSASTTLQYTSLAIGSLSLIINLVNILIR